MNAIQVMNEAKSEEEAAEIMDHFAKQEGYLGGRILSRYRPFYVQTFHDAAGVEASSPLPDGMRFVVIPKSLFAELGIIVEKAPPTTYVVSLTDVGPSKINVIKEVRIITGCGLREAKDLVESRDKQVKICASADEAEELAKRFGAVGASVRVVGMP